MTNPILQAIDHHAKTTPDAIALQGQDMDISYASLFEEIAAVQEFVQSNGSMRIGLLMDNGPAWAVIDLAVLKCHSADHADDRKVLVPLASFFSDQQLLHIISSASLDTIITDNPGRLIRLLPQAKARPKARIAGQNVWQVSIPQINRTVLPNDTVKITFTSGTTGAPKGVCLSAKAISSVALSLSKIVEVVKHDKHMALLPMSILLENIAGLYVALLRGV
ncbi:AMP-binding protein, partial [Kaarinaea lacus]